MVNLQNNIDGMTSLIQNDDIYNIIIQARKGQAKFQDEKLFRSGERSIQADIGEIGELLKQKNGIVPESEKESFQEKIR